METKESDGEDEGDDESEGDDVDQQGGEDEEDRAGCGRHRSHLY